MQSKKITILISRPKMHICSTFFQENPKSRVHQDHKKIISCGTVRLGEINMHYSGCNLLAAAGNMRDNIA